MQKYQYITKNHVDLDDNSKCDFHWLFCIQNPYKDNNAPVWCMHEVNVWVVMCFENKCFTPTNSKLDNSSFVFKSSFRKSIFNICIIVVQKRPTLHKLVLGDSTNIADRNIEVTNNCISTNHAQTFSKKQFQKYCHSNGTVVKFAYFKFLRVV